MCKRIAGILIASAGIVVSTRAWGRTWTSYTYIPSDTMATAQSFQKILSAIETATDKEVAFRLRLGGSLPIQVSNITQAVGNGTIMFADDGFFLGNVKIAGILRLPLDRKSTRLNSSH